MGHKKKLCHIQAPMETSDSFLHFVSKQSLPSLTDALLVFHSLFCSIQELLKFISMYLEEPLLACRVVLHLYSIKTSTHRDFSLHILFVNKGSSP